MEQIKVLETIQISKIFRFSVQKIILYRWTDTYVPGVANDATQYESRKIYEDGKWTLNPVVF